MSSPSSSSSFKLLTSAIDESIFLGGASSAIGVNGIFHAHLNIFENVDSEPDDSLSQSFFLKIPCFFFSSISSDSIYLPTLSKVPSTIALANRFEASTLPAESSTLIASSNS